MEEDKEKEVKEFSVRLPPPNAPFSHDVICTCPECKGKHVRGVDYSHYFPPVQDCFGRDEVLHIITPISNYVGFKRRYELFDDFRRKIEKLPFVRLYVVEVAMGDTPFVVTSKSNPRHIQLRTRDEIWHKENMINVAVQRLPTDWKYMAWVDGDIEFLRPDIAKETIRQLQTFKIVQMFQSVINHGPDGQVVSTFKSFCSQFFHKGADKYHLGKGYEFWHPGFAWACTRETWNELGGLPDFCVLGSADHHLALALIGKVRESVPGGVSPAYLKLLLEIQQRCDNYIRHNIGYVKGTILHFWHGQFKNRKYIERWQILTKHGFDPAIHLKRDWQGLYQLDADAAKLRDDIRRYFRQRNEDSVDLED